jgi:hypothetical protein
VSAYNTHSNEQSSRFPKYETKDPSTGGDRSDSHGRLHPLSPSVTRVVRPAKALRRYLRIEGNASQRSVQSERPGAKSRQVTSGGGTHNQTHQTQHRGTDTAIQKIEKTEMILGEKIERIKKPERSKHRTPRQPVSPKKHHSSQPWMKPTSVRRYVQAQNFLQTGWGPIKIKRRPAEMGQYPPSRWVTHPIICQSYP